MTVCYVMDNSSKELYTLEAFKRAMEDSRPNKHFVKIYVMENTLNRSIKETWLVQSKYTKLRAYLDIIIDKHDESYHRIFDKKTQRRAHDYLYSFVFRSDYTSDVIRAMKSGENNCNLVKLVSIIINKLDFDSMFKHCVIHK